MFMSWGTPNFCSRGLFLLNQMTNGGYIYGKQIF